MSGPHVHADLDALLDGALAPERQHAVEAHLASCVRCQAALGSARRIARDVAEAPAPDPGDAYWARFAARIESRLGPAPVSEPETATVYERLFRWLVPPGRWGWMGTASVLATATVAVYIGMRGYNPHEASMPAVAERAQRAVEPPPAAPPRPATPTPQPSSSDVALVVPPAGLAKDSRSNPAAGSAAEMSRDDAQAREQPEEGVLQAAPRAVKDEKTVVVTEGTDEPRAAESADRVLEFARAALQHSETAARARYAALAQDDFAAIPETDADLLRAWNGVATPDAGLLVFGSEAAPPPAAAGKAKLQNEVAPDASRLNVAEAMKPAPTPPPPPLAAQLRILDALVWPRRDQAGARQDVAALAQAWQPYVAADEHARERVRVLAAWLAETSLTGNEKARWEAVRSGAEQR